MAGEVAKTPAVVAAGNAGYAWATSVASGDTITVGADYGVFDTTRTQNCPPEVTTLRDPV